MRRHLYIVFQRHRGENDTETVLRTPQGRTKGTSSILVRLVIHMRTWITGTRTYTCTRNTRLGLQHEEKSVSRTIFFLLSSRHCAMHCLCIWLHTLLFGRLSTYALVSIIEYHPYRLAPLVIFPRHNPVHAETKSSIKKAKKELDKTMQHPQRYPSVSLVYGDK